MFPTIPISIWNTNEKNTKLRINIRNSICSCKWNKKVLHSSFDDKISMTIFWHVGYLQRYYDYLRTKFSSKNRNIGLRPKFGFLLVCINISLVCINITHSFDLFRDLIFGWLNFFSCHKCNVEYCLE